MIYHPQDIQASLIPQFQRIQPEAWICDPWADISCKGSQYSQKWREKMREWHNNHHYVLTNNSYQHENEIYDNYETFFSPLRENIYNIIQPELTYKLLKLAFIKNTGKLIQMSKDGVSDYNISEMNNMSYSELSKYYSY
ncbi:hypothetical protein [Xenorhabdus innexi]|uniref:Uncharacterized protein n=2 Tax=Xenorhabdus innexi TaxID=290109 RepID=A0A1N6MYV2_9GAMM|nr:hypothetical protein [Xenorhabdus innexi]SIP74053.1 hypothetical protein XIS1_500008 [Xenorhabdus innexi]